MGKRRLKRDAIYERLLEMILKGKVEDRFPSEPLLRLQWLHKVQLVSNWVEFFARGKSRKSGRRFAEMKKASIL